MVLESWIWFALLAAVFTAFGAIVEKRGLKKEHALEFSASLAVVTIVISIPLFFLMDFSVITLKQLIYLFTSTFLAAVGFLLTAKSIRHMEVSEVFPLLALNPALVTLLSFLILKETPSSVQIGGITLLVFGAFFLESKSNNIFGAFKVFKHSKYMHYIFIALGLYAVAALIDRVILDRLSMDPIAFIGFAHVFLALQFFVLLSLFHDGPKGIKHGFKTAGWWILLLGALLFGYRISQAFAVQQTNIGLVIAVKRLSTLLVVIMGGGLLHEKGMAHKLFAGSIMVVGVILIALF